MGQKLTQSEVNDFEASGFVLSDGEMDSISIEANLPLGESTSTLTSIPFSTNMDIQSLHPIGVSNPIVPDGDKRSKH